MKLKPIRTFKKHSSLRRVKIKRQRTNCVEFIGVENDKEKDIDIIDDEDEHNKENQNDINIYKRSEKRFKTGKAKVNFDIREYDKKKNEKKNINLDNKGIELIDDNPKDKIIKNNFNSSKNVKLHNRESLLLVEKWDVKNSDNSKEKINDNYINNKQEIVNVKKNMKSKFNKKIGKEGSQRELINKFSVK